MPVRIEKERTALEGSGREDSRESADWVCQDLMNMAERQYCGWNSSGRRRETSVPGGCEVVRSEAG